MTAEAQRRHGGENRPKRRRVTVFNRTSYYDSEDDEIPPPKIYGEVRERIISPWSSPYYNLRIQKWPVSPGPAKVLNADFDEDVRSAEDSRNPYEDFSSDASDSEFSLGEEEEVPVRRAPVRRAPPVKTQSVTLRDLMAAKKRQVQEKDEAALEELVEGVAHFFKRSPDDHQAPK